MPEFESTEKEEERSGITDQQARMVFDKALKLC